MDMVAVRYYTRGGNTKKLAETVGKVCGQKIETVDVDLAEKVDVLFLGCSYYAFDMDAKVKAFIDRNREKIGKIVCFGTSAMMKSMKKPLGKVLKGTGIELAAEEFHCPGSFGRVHRGRPNEADQQALSELVEKVLRG